MLTIFFRSWYVETAAPQPKDIVIVFDRSESMGTKRMRTAQEAAKTLIGTFNPSDRVSNTVHQRVHIASVFLVSFGLTLPGCDLAPVVRV